MSSFLFPFQGVFIVWLFVLIGQSLLPFAAWSQKITVAAGIGIVGFGAAPISVDILFRAVLLGFFFALPIIAILGCGAMIFDVSETGRGMTMATLIDPLIETPENPLSVLSRWLLLSTVGTLYLTLFVKGIKLLEVNDSDDLIVSLVYRSYEIVKIFLSNLTPLLLSFVLIELLSSLLSKIVPSFSLQLQSFVIKGGLSIMLYQVVLTRLCVWGR